MDLSDSHAWTQMVDASILALATPPGAPTPAWADYVLVAFMIVVVSGVIVFAWTHRKY